MTKAEALMDKGRAHLDAGRRKQAEACFRASARTHLTVHALNNWALCRYLDGDYDDALHILTPALGGAAPAPFTRALASLIRSAQGQQVAARELLNAAIRDFEAGLADPAVRGTAAAPGWIEYTIMIKRAAGELGDHRLVLDLHKRWPGRDLPPGAFFAGVAAFNLRKYPQAARYWQRIAHRDWTRLMDAHARVAELAERGVVPPFALEYDLKTGWEENNKDPEAARALAARGAVRVRLLAVMFSEEADDAATMAQGLIGETGEWGIDLGRRLLAGSNVPVTLKMGAAKALTDAGIFAPGQPIPVIHKGRSTSLVLRQMEVRDQDPELDRVVAEAIRLRDAGRKDEAYRLLSDLQAQGTAYPPAMLTLANLMRDRGELEAAHSQLESLERLTPEHPAVLFNLAGFWLEKGNLERARHYAKRIDSAGTTPEFRNRLADLKERLRLGGAGVRAARRGVLGDAWREDVEEKPISLDVTLRAALKGTPVQWLNAAAALHKLEPTRRRQEHERSLAAALQDPMRLREVLAAETPEVRAALRLLLENGGWSKLQALTRRYGPLDGDGFWWDERPPASPVGRLRALGLVYVGRARVDGKADKVAVVPADLREALSAALGDGK